MAPLSLLAAASFAVVSVCALPQPWDGPRGGWNQWNHWNGHWGRDATPTLPLNDVDNTGASPLPTPSNNVKYVALGLGYQNYSCSATQATPTGSWIQSVPSSGAIADLYDITVVVNKYTKDTITRNVLESFETCIKVTKCSPSPSNGYCKSCHDIAAAPYKSNQIGEHFFDQVNGAQSPNFDVYRKGDFLSGRKSASVLAPASAYDGANGLGAIAWLYLVPNASDLTHGLTGVYRVETAGGVAPSSCTQPGAQLEVPYAAEYWFYN